jgi:phosphate transport system permease protein
VDEQARGRRRAGEKFNTGLFTFGASSRPETSGMGVAIIGSLYMMLIVLVLALPIGVAASIYLEEFAAEEPLTDLIEVNINNLAAVPSIVFGLLGLAVFINFLGCRARPRWSAAFVLALMTLPTIIIATRAALRRRAAVDPLGRARRSAPRSMQMVFHTCAAAGHAGHPDRHHHRPGARARRDRAAAADRHGRLRRRLSDDAAFDPATALPVQIYMWANEAERAFVERHVGAIMILLAFLMVMNITAIVLRRASNAAGNGVR